MEKNYLIVTAMLVMVTFTVYGCKPSYDQQPPVTHYVWNFDMDNLQNLTITLPKVSDSESFVKHPDDQDLYFDMVNGPEVDNQRWGGAIPALLSGPEADNLVQKSATTSELQKYGLYENPSNPNDPDNQSLNMDIQLTILLNGTPVKYEIYIGDSNPVGTTYYIRLASNDDVYTVNNSWYDALADIITNPPYIQATLGINTPTVSSSTVAVGATETVSTNITNNGNVTGCFNINLLIGGNLVNTQVITLAPIASRVVTFQVIENTAGTYVASINQVQNVTFSVQ
jgi:Domain of unknown function (DUF4340)